MDENKISLLENVYGYGYSYSQGYVQYKCKIFQLQG